MSYIDQINSFHNWLIGNQISSSARLLWYSLLHYCNRLGWKSDFNVAMSALELDTGLSRQSIIRARNALQQAGLIDVVNRKGSQSTVYHLNLFVFQIGTQTDTQAGHKADTNRTPSDTQADTIHKTRQDKTKTRGNAAAARARDTGFGNVAKCYQDNIHPFTGPMESDKLQDLYAQYGEKWLLAGIEECVSGNGRSLNYLSAVLARWEKEGFRSPYRKQETMEDTLERARNAIGDFSDEITEEQLKNMLEVD